MHFLEQVLVLRASSQGAKVIALMVMSEADPSTSIALTISNCKLPVHAGRQAKHAHPDIIDEAEQECAAEVLPWQRVQVLRHNLL